MSARQKIEALTNSWYGYYLFGAATGLLHKGLGLFSLLGAAISFGAACVLTWFLGRRLLARSSLTRGLLVLVSAVVTFFSTLGAAKAGWSFLHGFSLADLVYVAFAGVTVFQYGRSFKVLTDDGVKGYFS